MPSDRRFFIIVVLLGTDLCSIGNAQFCRLLDGGPGSCRPFFRCPPLRQLVNQPGGHSTQAVIFLNSLRCRNFEGYSGYCCPFNQDSFSRRNDLDDPQQGGGFSPNPFPTILDSQRLQSSIITTSTNPPTTTERPTSTAAPDAGGRPPVTDVQLNPEGCGVSSVLRPFILGGSPAPKNSWPWIARIGHVPVGSQEIYWSCGGSLFTKRHVLTAGHCFQASKRITRFGEHDVSVTDESEHLDVPVAAQIRHEAYRLVPFRHDIMILLLEQDVPFTKTIRPVCLPYDNDIRGRDLANEKVMVAGWGHQKQGGNPSTVLMEVTLSVVPQAECEKDYSSVPAANLDQDKICAGGGKLDPGKDACQLDSGGPMIYAKPRTQQTYFLVGIVSAGIGCANETFPGFCTRVTSYLTWIEDVLKGTPGVGRVFPAP